MATITERRRQDGTVAFTAQIRLKRGGRVVHTESRTFAKRKAAAEWARDREAALRDDPAAAARQAHAQTTLGDLIGRYLDSREAIEPLGRTKKQHLLMMRGFALAAVPALDLTREAVIAHIQGRRAAGTGPATANNDLVWLRVVLRHARVALGVPVDERALVDDAASYLKSERLVARSRKRTRRPSDAELRRIDAHLRRSRAKFPARLMMWFAIYSCRRLSELCRMRISDLDRERSRWLIRDVKSPGGSAGHDLWMHVPEKLWPLIEIAIKTVPRDDDRLFPFGAKTASTYWTRQMHVMGVDDLHWHDLRREGCSRLAEDGATIPEIARVSLHESWGSLQIYVDMPARSSARVEWSD
jgi:integrase